MFSFGGQKQKARGSGGCIAGISRNLGLSALFQTEVTCAREASDRGDNRGGLA
jgi:hypothetical protein